MLTNTEPCYVPHLRSRWEEGAGHTVHVLGIDLDADIIEAHGVKAEGTSRRAKITLASIG